MKFVACITKQEAEERIGRDWAKLVRVEGGWMGFETVQEYETWRAQR